MKQALLGRAVEVAFAQLFRLGTRLVLLAHLTGFGQRIRNAWWRVRLQSLDEVSLIHPYVVIHTPGKVSIDASCVIVKFVNMWDGDGITIGNYVLNASYTVISALMQDTNAGVYR